MSSFKKEDFDKLVKELKSAIPDSSSHDDAINEKVSEIDKMRKDAEKYIKRKNKYEVALNIIKDKELELSRLRESSRIAIESLNKEFQKKYQDFEQNSISRAVETKDSGLMDYVVSTIADEFGTSKDHLERELDKLRDLERKHTQSDNKIPRVIIEPMSGKVDFIDLTIDKPSRKNYEGDYIVIATRVPIHLKVHEKRDIFRVGTRSSFGRNIS